MKCLKFCGCVLTNKQKEISFYYIILKVTCKGIQEKQPLRLNMGIKKASIDLINRTNRRGSISPEYVVFRERLPLALNNHIKNRSERSSQKVCMQEMMGFMDCMVKYGQDKSMCAQEFAA